MMEIDVQQEIENLRHMTVKQLRQRHIELFGEPNNSGHREYLFRRMAWRVQAMAKGGLSERAKQRARELAREADVRLRPTKDQGRPASQVLTRPGQLAVRTRRRRCGPTLDES